MARKITDAEMWEIVGYIKVSSIRLKILKSLKDSFLMPSEIARMTGYRTTQISNSLRELKEKDLVQCLNEDAKKGRIYQNTELGLLILEVLDSD